ncbi:DNA polymerase family A-domain-containing protein, partial [Rhizoctonia solani]
STRIYRAISSQGVLTNRANQLRPVRRVLKPTVENPNQDTPTPVKFVGTPVSPRKDVDLSALSKGKPSQTTSNFNTHPLQMLSSKLHPQVFPGPPLAPPSTKATQISKPLASRLPETSFDLPALQGNSIDEHFYNIGAHMAMPCETKKGLPPRPEQIEHHSGWTRYDADGLAEQVEDLGSESAICFDVETMPGHSPFPTAWYVWISPWLLGLDSSCEHLIPIGDPSRHRVIVGHNEYSMQGTKNRFLDTMSLHRPAYQRQLEEIEITESQPELDQEHLEGSLPTLNDSEDQRWEEITSINSLADLDKSTRDDFMTSTREQIAERIDTYLEYCCDDVATTLSVYQASCPNPVSLAGVLTMGKWENYISSAERKYHELEGGVRETLLTLAKEALAKYENDTEGNKPWEADEWLSQLDWTPRKVGKSRGVEPPETPPPQMLPKPGATIQDRIIPFLLGLKWKPAKNLHGWLSGWINGRNRRTIGDHDELAPFRDKFTFSPLQSDSPTRKLLTRKNGASWIKEESLDMAVRFCTGTASDSDWDALRAMASTILAVGVPSQEQLNTMASTLQLNWKEVQVGKPPPRNPADEVYWPKWYWDLTAPKPDTERGTVNLTVRSQIAPLLLRLKWMDYPLFHSRTHGWTYRVPKQDLEKIGTTSKPLEFPDEADEKLKTMCEEKQFCFFKLPHKDGDQANVGSPMSKTFLKYSQDALNMNAQCSYWISARDRVLKQVVVWDQQAKINIGLDTSPPPPQLTPPPSSPEIPEPKLNSVPPRKYGMILPQVITMGTVTRRAIEKTWLTASNAKPNRVGSELKTLVRAPEGYAIVGADVDSEELWIASVIGDAQFGIHGATAIGWMTLEGTKAAGTDLHSKTANILGISRNHAKVFNYSRIYGAGVNHAVLLLLQNSASMKQDTAMALAKNLYASTKGKSTYSTTMFGRKFWYGGTESYLFNKLEQIATSDNPRTPALGCGVTSALSKKYLSKDSGGDYMTSRINWVVQSSGVDYLHMLIVAARYLISIHDEVRYLAKDEDKYRLSLALQVANLWTRCMFAYKLGFDNLPQGVAFFSAVDIDKYLRKEVDMTCVTPSQPIPLPPGESLDIDQILEKTSGGYLCVDDPSLSAGSKPKLTPPREPYTAPDVLAHREAYEEFLEAQYLNDTSDIRMLAQVARSREREKAAELETRANVRPKPTATKTGRIQSRIY